ncbi:MAG: 50S ribosomal protein L25/general stress protein Ctc [Actinomycetes bacterium]
MAEVRISAEPRTEFGKGAARRVRRASKVPAVLYGHGTDPRHISLPWHDLMMALKNSNVLLRLDGMGDGTELAIPKAVQRDPVKGFLEHVDLLLVKKGEKVVVDIPLHIEGDLVPDGMLDHGLDTLSVECEATNIPTSFTVSIQGLPIGESIYAKDVKLPSGVTLDAEPDAMIAHIIPAPTAEELEAELEQAEAEAGIERDESVEEAETPAAEQGEPAEPEGERPAED